MVSFEIISFAFGTFILGLLGVVWTLLKEKIQKIENEQINMKNTLMSRGEVKNVIDLAVQALKIDFVKLETNIEHIRHDITSIRKDKEGVLLQVLEQLKEIKNHD